MMMRPLHNLNLNNPNSNILYIHQGGLIGNETMIQRYEYKMEQIIKKNS
jgi:1-aminocyclopropane-1-carboxylate deaminase/D-cysteine desulfhydrase-like pyridoxal-dependent ACC family enzyme